jgi:hypothetical protein
MNRDILFLLAPGFLDGSRREYCPECAEIWGLLSYFPAIKATVDIRYQPILKPRNEIVQLLGEKNQNCPTLVLSETSPEFHHCGTQSHNGKRFIDNARDMGLYYAQRFGVAAPRGHQRDA